MNRPPAVSALPFDDIRDLFRQMPGPDTEMVEKVRARDAVLTKPAGALGRLETIVEWLAAWQALAPDLRRRFAAQGATVARNVEAAFGDDGIRDDLRYLDVPTLLISGGRSTAAARATTRIAASLMRCAKTAEIASAGHMAPVTHADAVLRLVRAWLDDGAAAHRLAV